MKQVILDTNFILTCLRNKIDFFEEIMFMGLQVVIPLQVIEEIKKIKEGKKKLKFRDEARLALKLLDLNKFEKIDLGKKYVDKGIINYVRDKEVIVATLDREIKEQIPVNRMVIKDKRTLEIL